MKTFNMKNMKERNFGKYALKQLIFFMLTLFIIHA